MDFSLKTKGLMLVWEAIKERRIMNLICRRQLGWSESSTDIGST